MVTIDSPAKTLRINQPQFKSLTPSTPFNKNSTPSIRGSGDLAAACYLVNLCLSMVPRDLAEDKEYHSPQPGPLGRVFGGSGETSEQVLRLSLGARSLENLVAFKERSNETCVLFDEITASG